MATPISMHFDDVHDLICWMPSAPEYVAGNGAWASREMCALMVSLSESGLDAVRRRLRNAYEHRDEKRQVWIYFPYWFRVYYAYKAAVDRQR